MASENKRRAVAVGRIKKHLKLVSIDKYKDEFKDVLHTFVDNAIARENIKKQVLELVVIVLVRPGQEESIMQKHFKAMAPFFKKCFKDDEEKLNLFFEYFKKKLIETVFCGLRDNKQALFEIFKKAIEEIRLDFLWGTGSTFKNVSIAKWINSSADSTGFVGEKEGDKTRIFARDFHVELKRWAREEDHEEDRSIHIPIMPKKMLMVPENGWISPLGKVIFGIFAILMLTRGFGEMSQFGMNVASAGRSLLAVLTIAMVLYPPYSKIALPRKIKKDVFSKIKNNLSIDWENIKQLEYFPVIIRHNFVKSSVSSYTSPALSRGMTAHAYMKEAGIDLSLLPPSVDEDEDSPGDYKGDSKRSSQSSCHIVFNEGKFTLEALKVPSEQYAQFIAGFNKGIVHGGKHNPPGIVMLNSNKKRETGWAAELIPTGNLGGRLLATETLEKNGSRTLHFRYYQSKHDLKNWPVAPPPLPPGYTTDANRSQGLSLGGTA